MARESRRRFLRLMGLGATAALARPVAAKADQLMQVMGYDAVPLASSTLRETFDPALSAFASVISSLQKSIQDSSQWNPYFQEIDAASQQAASTLAGKTMPWGDQDTYQKVIAVNSTLYAQYKYNEAGHDNACSLENPALAAIDPFISVDCVLSPQSVAKYQASDCIDFAAAAFEGLKHLGVPPQDILLVVGSVHRDSASLSQPDSKVGGGHAWVLVRDPQSKQFIVMQFEELIGAAPGTSFFNIVSNAWFHDGKELDFFVPRAAMDGNGNLFLINSVDQKDVPIPQNMTTARPVYVQNMAPVNDASQSQQANAASPQASASVSNVASPPQPPSPGQNVASPSPPPTSSGVTLQLAPTPQATIQLAPLRPVQIAPLQPAQSVVVAP